jgi:hypothetical protein
MFIGGVLPRIGIGARSSLHTKRPRLQQRADRLGVRVVADESNPPRCRGYDISDGRGTSWQQVCGTLARMSVCVHFAVGGVIECPVCARRGVW